MQNMRCEVDMKECSVTSALYAHNYKARYGTYAIIPLAVFMCFNQDKEKTTFPLKNRSAGQRPRGAFDHKMSLCSKSCLFAESLLKEYMTVSFCEPLKQHLIRSTNRSCQSFSLRLTDPDLYTSPFKLCLNHLLMWSVITQQITVNKLTPSHTCACR